MTEITDNNIESLAASLRAQRGHLRVDTFLSIVATGDAINRYLDIQLAKQSISRTGFNVLHALILNGGIMTPTNISKRIYRSKHTVTRVIDTLEKQGFVERASIGEDRRNRKVSITKEGFDFIESVQDDAQSISTTVFLPLEKKQVEELNKILRRLRKHVRALISYYDSPHKD